VLDLVVHQNIRVTDVIVPEILDSDNLSVLFHILDHVKIINFSEPIKKFPDWELFQSLTSELILPKINIKSWIEVDKGLAILQPLLLRRIDCRQVRLQIWT
jgi:hypothetical protein